MYVKAKDNLAALREDGNYTNFIKGNEYRYLQKEDSFILIDEDKNGFSCDKEVFEEYFETVFDPKNMTRDQMIGFIKENSGIKITHELFGDDEYLVGRGNVVYDENGYVFETWIGTFHNGIRMRTGGLWETGWSVKN